ncbi:hypothetical protein QJS66_01070 [Kocuria rhizophila]|nr:hypothetical protein QJS66_01070 [Kocuria rhizophila]
MLAVNPTARTVDPAGGTVEAGETRAGCCRRGGRGGGTAPAAPAEGQLIPMSHGVGMSMWGDSVHSSTRQHHDDTPIHHAGSCSPTTRWRPRT